MKFLLTPQSVQGIIFGHCTKHIQGSDLRLLEKALQTPSVFIFSMLVGVHTATPPPVSTLCALLEPPCYLGFLYHWVGWLSIKQWGSSTTRAEAFSNKGQWCWLESFSAAKTPQPCVNLTFHLCFLHFFFLSLSLDWWQHLSGQDLLSLSPYF